LNRADLTELSFFMLRWSDAWEISSLEHFSKKWNLPTNDKYFKKRYKRMGHRRYQGFLRPLVRQISFGQNNPQLEQLLIPLERSLNRLISDRYTKSAQ
jgi:hypothetical protein